MSAIFAIGPSDEVRGFALAGVTVIAAGDAAEALAAWEGLPTETAVVILAAETHAALLARLRDRPSVLTAVLP